MTAEKIHFSIVLVILLISPSAFAAELGCKGNPSLIGRCYWVRGFVGMSADALYVLQPDSKNSGLLILRDAPRSRRGWPPSLSKAIDSAQHAMGSVDARVHGQFEVCPIPADEEAYRYVCVEEARQLKSESLDGH